MTFFKKIEPAIRQAACMSDHCIGWSQEESGWTIYNPVDGAPEGVTPEFLCVGKGLPLPLNDIAVEVLISLAREVAAR